MKKLNMPLIIGSLIIILILAVILFPSLFTSKSPYNIQHIIFSHEGGSLQVATAPFPPSSDFMLGSDDMGRDIYSFIIYGTGLTILLGVLIALGRFLIAIPLALSAGFGNGISKSAVRQFNILFSAIPALLISVIILKLDFFAGLDKSASVLAFVAILSIVGWPKLGALMTERVVAINSMPYIRSEVAIGKSRFKIAVENVFPHLAPEMVVLFFMEIARALSMIMQMGIFSVFVGFLKIIKDTEGGISFYDISFEPEWAGMLSTSRNMISTAPWAVIFPALAFFISVLGFNLFGEGLRNLLQKPDSLFIPRIRKLMSFDIKYIWSSFGRKSRVVTIGSILLVIVLAVSVPVVMGKENPVPIECEGLPEFSYVSPGTGEAHSTAGYISMKMKELGLVPLDSDEYIHRYGLNPYSLIIEQKLTLGENDGLIAGKDFSVRNCREGEFRGSIYDASTEDLFSMSDFGPMADLFVMIDTAYYNDAAVLYLMNKIKTDVQVRGFLLVTRSGESLDYRFAARDSEIPIVYISGNTADLIRDTGVQEISLEYETRTLDTTGMNIIGMLEGTDPLLSEEAIVIGLPYNYSDEDERDVLGFGINVMEEICGSGKNRRSVIFMFIDGTEDIAMNGINQIADDYPFSASKTKLYLNLTDLNESEFDDIVYSAKQAPFTRQYAWSMGRQLQKNIERKGIGIEEAETIFFGDQYYFTGEPSYNTMFMQKGLATIIAASVEKGNGSHNLGELGRILVDTISDNNY